jgi:dihydrofolate synthase / folylpolyglutamate synthase
LCTTLPEIAYQKAGIMHAGNQEFMLQQPAEITNMVREQARLRQAYLTVLDAQPPQPLHVQLTPLPLFQQRNWWLARQVYKYLARRDELLDLSPEQLAQTMDTRVPGRMDHVDCKKVDLILDVAHNPQKMNMLVKSLQCLYPHKAVAVMILIGGGKDSRSILAQLQPLRPSLICSAYNYIEGLRHQAHPASVLAKEAHEIGFDRVTAEANPGRALALLLQRPEPIKIITGSVYGVSQVKQLIDDLNRPVTPTPEGLP